MLLRKNEMDKIYKFNGSVLLLKQLSKMGRIFK